MKTSVKGSPSVFKGDPLFKNITAICASTILIIMLGMFIQLIWHSRLSIGKFGLKFLISDAWNPVTQNFGALNSIFGTLVSSAIAMLIAVPISLFSALFLVELAPKILSKIVGSTIEMLAAIPSIIFGMAGLFVFAPYMQEHVEPFLQDHFGYLPLFKGPPMGIGMLTAGFILALMIIPFITAVSRDVFQLVPLVLKESAYGIGATTWEVVRKVTMKYGMRGILGACFLGLGRAIGETMAITFVIGNNHKISASLFSASNSIASTLANEFTEAVEPLYLSSLIELGLVLFLMTIIIQIIAHLWLKKIEKKMGVKE